MASFIDFTMTRYQDGVLTIPMSPATNVSGWAVRFELMKRYGASSGLTQKWAASGFNGVSGVSVVNGAQGIFQVTVNGPDMSGQEFGNYPYSFERLDSGFRTPLTEGYMLYVPGTGNA